VTASGGAYRIDGELVAREAFYAAACDPQRSVVVEACAGSGKTWMLVSRILRALLAGAQPHEILAITFTRKAAGEMRARLNEWLAEFASPGTSDTSRVQALRARGMTEADANAAATALAGLHERVLRAGRPVEIRTIHAWFSQLLHAAPIELLAELGLQPDMALIEDLDEHAGEVYRRFHAALVRDAGLRADYEQLVSDRGRTQTRKWLDAALARRVELELADEGGVLDDSVVDAAALWPEYAPYDHPAQRVRHPLVAALMLDVAAALAAQTKDTPRRRGALLLAAFDLEGDSAVLDAARAALRTKAGVARRHLDAPGLAEALALLDDIQRAAAQHHAREEHLRMVRLARILLTEFAAYKRSRGLADMADLERCALALLRDSSLAGWVQERLDSRIRHLLVDEFQDTSPLQWHALHSWISGFAGAGGGGSGQQPLGVFIVGDPKQSIYRFRRAEPRVFAAAREFVRQGLAGRVLECDHTRRNAPGVLAALNPVFEAAVANAEFEGFRAHTTEVEGPAGPALFALPGVPRPAAPGGDASAGPAAWRDSLASPRHEPEELLRQEEARWVARGVQELVAQGGCAPDEVLVLCRKRASLRLVAQELQALHLPCAAVEEATLMDQPEVRDLVATLDALASTQHRLALAQSLRSPLFGASDDDLMWLAEHAGASGDWWRALTGNEPPSEALQRAAGLLRQWQAAARTLPPQDLLDRIVAEGDLHARVAAAVPRERRAAALDAIDALIAQALTLDGARYATPYGFVRALKRNAAKFTPPQRPNAVQLLTVHGAKGLEADVVFVVDADPEANPAETMSLLVDWPVESEHPVRCAFIASETNCPPSLQALLADDLAARRREELNGLYVAMTRARARLVLSRTEPFHPTGRSWWQRLELLATPWSPKRKVAAAGGNASFALPCLPRLPSAGSAPPNPPAKADPAGAALARLGSAIHRVLEWATIGGAAPLDELAAAAAAEFDAPLDEVRQGAARILQSPACTRFFDGPALRWGGNEVAVADAGEVIRIDRLVALSDTGAATGREWWVLDYKLHHSPQALEAYRQQLLRYRDAVRVLQPGEVVHCAFVTGAGELVEIDAA